MGNVNPTLNCLKSGTKDRDDDQDDEIGDIKRAIENLKDNHLSHLKEKVDSIEVDIRFIKRDIRDILNRMPTH